MSKQQAKRNRVCDLLDAQIPQKDIAKIVGISERTIRRIQHARQSSLGTERSPGSGGHNKKRDAAFLNTLKKKIKEDPTVSMRKHAKILKVDPKTIRTAVHKDLGLKSFARMPRHLLTDRMKQTRLERCHKIHSFLKHNGSTVKIFSDEKIFTVDQVYNRRNDRWIAETTQEVKGVFRTKHPAQVMVLGVLGSDGNKMPPYFFKPNQKIGADVYYKVLRYTVLPWLKATYPDNNYVWQQDGAPAHTSNKVQKFCEENMANFWPKDFWPPSSPDLNPLDFFWWSAIESRTNATPHANMDSLKAAISREWEAYPKEDIRRACASFRGRIEACIMADGGHIE